MQTAEVRRQHAADILAEGLVKLLERDHRRPPEPTPQRPVVPPRLRLVPREGGKHEQK